MINFLKKLANYFYSSQLKLIPTPPKIYVHISEETNKWNKRALDLVQGRDPKEISDIVEDSPAVTDPKKRWRPDTSGYDGWLKPEDIY